MEAVAILATVCEALLTAARTTGFLVDRLWPPAPSLSPWPNAYAAAAAELWRRATCVSVLWHGWNSVFSHLSASRTACTPVSVGLTRHSCVRRAPSGDPNPQPRGCATHPVLPQPRQNQCLVELVVWVEVMAVGAVFRHVPDLVLSTTSLGVRVLLGLDAGPSPGLFSARKYITLSEGGPIKTLLADCQKPDSVSGMSLK